MTEAGRLDPAIPPTVDHGAGSLRAFIMQSENFTVEWLPLDSVRPYPGNPRIITDAAIAKVAASIKEFGWRQPIVVDPDHVIIVGHTRHRAAQMLQIAAVPVHVATGLSEDRIKAYRLADNRTGEESRWNLELLDLELSALGAEGFDLKLTGFDPVELPTPPSFAPLSSDEVKPLDIRALITCPSCNHQFERR